MACRKNSIDNEQDNNIMYSLLLSYICHRKEPINVLILKTIFKPIKILKAYEKVIYSRVWCIICYVC